MYYSLFHILAPIPHMIWKFCIQPYLPAVGSTDVVLSTISDCRKFYKVSFMNKTRKIVMDHATWISQSLKETLIQIIPPSPMYIQTSNSEFIQYDILVILDQLSRYQSSGSCKQKTGHEYTILPERLYKLFKVLHYKLFYTNSSKLADN